MRCVPDVSAISDANFNNVDLGPTYLPENGSDAGVLLYENGQALSATGTSLACPVFAGIAALVNQARASAGLGPIGLLNPHLYPLAGTNAFNDVVAGNNGFYSAGPGYDLCTGLGSPNAANLIAALSSTAADHRLVNLSSRVQVGTGSNVVIAGLVINGPAGTTKEVLVRGVGPTLSSFGVTGALANPVMDVFDSSVPAKLIAENIGWGNLLTAGTSTSNATYRQATVADMNSAGAFPLAAGSADSAMVLTLPSGSYTVQISGAVSTNGIALAEIYELEAVPGVKLVNISSRCFVGTGAEVGIAGFVINGTKPAQLLIRGVGPTLSGFGVAGALAQPLIQLYDSAVPSVLIAKNTGWGNAPLAGTSAVAATYRQATAADMSSVGAFPLSAGSQDSAMVVVLPPGSYTAQVSGVGGTTGTALVEVYEMSGP
jgi:hypothetical protein